MDELIAEIKLQLGASAPVFVLSDYVEPTKAIRLDGKMFEDSRPRIVLHSKWKREIRKFVQKKCPKARIRIDTATNAAWKLTPTKVIP